MEPIELRRDWTWVPTAVVLTRFLGVTRSDSVGLARFCGVVSVMRLVLVIIWMSIVAAKVSPACPSCVVWFGWKALEQLRMVGSEMSSSC